MLTTMKLHLTALTAFLFLIQAAASAQSVDSLFFAARGSFNQAIEDGNYTPTFQGDHLNFNIYGHLSESITYRVRQRLHNWGDANNPFRATDWLCVNWQATDRLRLTAGKTAALIGGYEYDSAAIDVYFYSRFCNNLDQAYVFSANAAYEFLQGQELEIQVGNSPLADGVNKQLAYNLAWKGRFAPWWQTIWSLNFVEDRDRSIVNYIALGNHFTLGRVAVDIDFINRAGFGQEQFLLSDFSLIGKVIWSVGKWNVCGKFGYETNISGNVRSDGTPFDRIIAPGTRSTYGGFGLEYFPLGSDRLRLHAIYYTDTLTRIHNIQAGITWRFDVISRGR